MDFKDMAYIIAIADHKNISQAARSLHITQPALSQQLHKIETQLGKPLFTRSGHTLTPTAACRIVCDQGRKMLAERDMMLYAINRLQDSAEETLRLGMSRFYARLLLPGIMRCFHKRHPFYSVQFIDSGSSLQLEQDVLDGNLDCCLLPLYPSNPELSYLEIGTENIYLAIPRDHPLNQLASPDGTIDINMTRNEPFILHRDSDKISHTQEHLFKNAGFTPRAVYHASGWDTVISFISSGMGLGLMTGLITNGYNSDQLPCFYRVKNMNLSRPFVLGYRRGHPVTPAMEKLYEISREEFQKQKNRL